MSSVEREEVSRDEQMKDGGGLYRQVDRGVRVTITTIATETATVAAGATARPSTEPSEQTLDFPWHLLLEIATKAYPLLRTSAPGPFVLGRLCTGRRCYHQDYAH